MNIFPIWKISNDYVLPSGTRHKGHRRKCGHNKQMKKHVARVSAESQRFTDPKGVFADTTFILSNLISPTSLASSSLPMPVPVSAGAAARDESRARVEDEF